MFKNITNTAGLVLAFILVSSPLSARRKKESPMPPFQVGITGIYAVPSSPEWEEVIVTGIEKDSSAFGKIQKNDVIVSAGGLKLASPDPRVMLGNAITQAESKDGEMKLTVRRSGKEVDVILNLEVMGPYSKTWPLNCDKTKKIVDAAVSDIIKRIDKGDLEFGNREGSMAALFLLSTGKPEHVEVAREYVGVYLDAFDGKVSSSTWNNGFLSLALGEYYLRTGDRRTLKPIKALVDNSYERMTCGGWSHRNYPNAGYVRSGTCTAAIPRHITLVILPVCPPSKPL